MSKSRYFDNEAGHGKSSSEDDDIDTSNADVDSFIVDDVNVSGFDNYK